MVAEVIRPLLPYSLASTFSLRFAPADSIYFFFDELLGALGIFALFIIVGSTSLIVGLSGIEVTGGSGAYS